MAEHKQQTYTDTQNTHRPNLAQSGVPLMYDTLFIQVKVPEENTDPAD